MTLRQTGKLLFAAYALTQHLAAETVAPDWIATVDRLPDAVEEKLYVIPKGVRINRSDVSVTLEVKVYFVCGFKSAIFLNKPETKPAYARVVLRKDGEVIASSGQGIERLASANEQYVFLESIWVAGKAVPRAASLYEARFFITLKKGDPVANRLTEDAFRNKAASIQLIMFSKCFVVSKSQWRDADAWTIEIREPKE
jgi:hypothetical protein